MDRILRIVMLSLLCLFALRCKDDENNPAAPTIPTQGLVAYYPFNENANDESGNGHNGTVHGAILTVDRFGNFSAYSFDGASSYIQCNTFPILDSAFTYAVWIRVSRPSGEDINNNFGSFGSSGTGIDTWSFGYNVNHQWFVIEDHSNGVKHYVAAVASAWKFVVVRYSGTTRSFYLDSKMLGTPQNITTPVASLPTDFLRIGSHTNSGEQQFMGSIDDIRIYNRALSDAEIWALYDEGGWAE